MKSSSAPCPPNGPNIHYVQDYRYPTHGGFAAFLARCCASRTSSSTIELVARRSARPRVALRERQDAGYERLVSSVPLPDLIPMIRGAPRDVLEAAEHARLHDGRAGQSRTQPPRHLQVELDLLLRRRVSLQPRQLPAEHSPHTVPPGMGSIQAEVYFSKKYKPLDEPAAAVHRAGDRGPAHVRRDSRRTTEIVFRDAMVIPYANIIFDLDRAAALKTVHGYLDDLGIGYCGRYGEWGYLWSDEAFLSGESAAQKALERERGLVATAEHWTGSTSCTASASGCRHTTASATSRSRSSRCLPRPTATSSWSSPTMPRPMARSRSAATTQRATSASATSAAPRTSAGRATSATSSRNAPASSTSGRRPTTTVIRAFSSAASASSTATRTRCCAIRRHASSTPPATRSRTTRTTCTCRRICPSERFIRLLTTIGLCNAHLGLIRRAAAAKTRLIASERASDVHFLAELALYGKFHAHPRGAVLPSLSRAVVELESHGRRHQRKYYAPGSKAHFGGHTWRKFGGLLSRHLARADLVAREDDALSARLARMAAWDREHLGRELARGLPVEKVAALNRPSAAPRRPRKCSVCSARRRSHTRPAGNSTSR